MNALLAGKYIAITRPAEQAKKLADLITNAGGTPILFPLIEITPLADYTLFDATLNQIEHVDWAIFISSNAVQNSMPRFVKRGIPATVNFAAIGPVTAAELKEFGVAQVFTPQSRFDSEALLELPEMRNMEGKKVMIFRGVGGREILAESLIQRGATVNFAECYQRTNPQKNCQVLHSFWNEKKLHGIVVTSSEAMRHLLDLARDSEWLKNTPIFVNHARVAEQALRQNLQVHVALTGGDEAMFKKLTTTL
ncbi:MAG: uroporphyrinogen-III synthase [Methylophilaceae bacterium]